MYAKTTIFDLVLPGSWPTIRSKPEELYAMGEGDCCKAEFSYLWGKEEYCKEEFFFLGTSL